MAFTTPLVVNGRSYPSAYIRASLRHCCTQRTVVQLEVWESAAERTADYPPLPYPNDLKQYPTDLGMQAANPIAYAYTLLEQSGEFPDATWNV